MARRLKSSSAQARGDLWIVLAALLWATDALVRVRSLESLHSAFVVFAEHAVILVLLLPLLFARRFRTQLFALSRREMALAALIGAGGSGIATLLFTESFRYLNPSVTILLQKLQPVAVVLLARVFLQERPRPSFYAWAALALAAATVLGFPNTGLSAQQWDFELRGTLYAVGAAMLWAASTVAGRGLLLRRPVFTVTFWRFVWGGLALVPVLAVLPPASGIGAQTHMIWSDPELAGVILFMGLGPGLLAMAAYYRGMALTPASRVTFIELIFPVCAVVLNAVFLGATLSTLQIVAGAVLIFAVTQIHREPR